MEPAMTLFLCVMEGKGSAFEVGGIFEDAVEDA